MKLREKQLKMPDTPAVNIIGPPENALGINDAIMIISNMNRIAADVTPQRFYYKFKYAITR